MLKAKLKDWWQQLGKTITRDSWLWDLLTAGIKECWSEITENKRVSWWPLLPLPIVFVCTLVRDGAHFLPKPFVGLLTKVTGRREWIVDICLIVPILITAIAEFVISCCGWWGTWAHDVEHDHKAAERWEEHLETAEPGNATA